MHVALKYCGGCDPQYERTDYFRSVQDASDGHIDWVRLDDDHVEAILLICGCDTACIEDEMPTDVPLICVKSDQIPARRLVNRILDLRGND